ncbi:MAG TPA: hypothetical protein GX497_03425 [Bacillus bacterium]|nr:hypothetical protein [Bacillus sp. (in: firmicutes)]
MNTQILQAVIEVVFGSIFAYLTPALFLLMVVLFGDRLVGLIYDAVVKRRWN